MGMGLVTKKLLVVLFMVVIMLVAALVTFLPEQDLPEDAPFPGEIEETVQGYVQALAANDWDKAGAFLSGEALLLHRRNTLHATTPSRAEIRQMEKIRLQCWGRHAVAEIRCTLDLGGLHLEEHLLRLSLVKEDQWKICGTEELPEELPGGYEEKEVPPAREVVQRTILNITAGRWEAALADMTGKARQEAERTLAVGQHPLSSEINGLRLTPIRIDGKVGWFEAVYGVKGFAHEEEATVKMIFRLKKIQGLWKVFDTELISLDDKGV